MHRADRHEGVDVIAHRGASAYAPENTIAAFALAAEQGAPWFELDTYLTADKHVIVLHDTTIDRTTSGEGPVGEHTLAELKQLDAGSWRGEEFAGERMPTLEESLIFARENDIGVYIEPKSIDDDAELFAQKYRAIDGAERLSQGQRMALMDLVQNSGTRNLAHARAVIAAVRKTGMEREVVVQSFSPVICFVTLMEAPELRTELLINRNPDNPEQWDRLVAFGMAIGVHGFNAHHDSLDPETIAEFQRAGKRVAVWTVNNRERMEEMVSWGVDSIITDYPDIALEVVAETR